MSTLSSWIDPAEITELLPFLLPNEGGKDDAGEETKSADDGDLEVPTEESTEPESIAASEEIVEVIDARDDADTDHGDPPPAEAVSEPAPKAVPPAPDSALPATASEIDFNTPDAYDAAAFPEAGEDSREAAGPDRRSAAVQASVALERARSRADEVGLLKSRRDGGQTLGAEAPDTGKPAVAGRDESPEVPAGDELESAPAPAETASGEDLAVVEAEPGTFRYRLAQFAKSAVELTGGSNPAVTDSQSYPLYSARNGNRAASPQSVESILRMNRLIRDFPGPQNDESGGTTQIALSGGRWLCLLFQDSVSGGICASLQVPAPVSDETAAELHRGLRTALAASPE